jgi:general stress protein YciG
MANNQNKQQSSQRGFASMDEDKQRDIASKGGKAAHEQGTAHEFDSQRILKRTRRVATTLIVVGERTGEINVQSRPVAGHNLSCEY